ncbi:11972_t:CDS:2 [Racocetra fulgida]|uniref:11972_t:CDS:1 n=1 Tax=Racocetra fulgida TaxID=60492 RepID=A0A9N8ZYU4_9GLOM|nr:11972_t:CDS:2 [Racocetra fulgida]
MSCRPRDEEIRVAHLVKGLSLDENEWEELDNQSMEMDIECIRHDSKDDNVDTWEPDRYEIILGRIRKDYEYNEFVSDLLIEWYVLIGRKEEEEAKRREEYDLF